MDSGTCIARGSTAELYLCQDRVLKLFHERSSGTEAAYEAGKQRIAYACGLLAPQVFAVTRIEGRQAIVMEYIQGPTIGEQMRQNPAEAPSLLARSFEVQRSMHAKTVPDMEPMKDKLSRQIKAALPLDADCRERLLACLDEMFFPQQLCHGDFHVFNLVQSQAGIAILDWADASAGHPLADVCRTYLLYLPHSTEWAEFYLQMVCAAYRVSRQAVLQWMPIVAGARLSERISPEQAAPMLGILRRTL